VSGRWPDPPRPFPDAARTALANVQLGQNLARATTTIRGRRAAAVAQVEGWDELRESARQIKAHTLRHLDRYLEQLEAAVQARGGTVHWARDAAEAAEHVVRIAREERVREVVKVKSLTTDEIGLNDALARAGVEAVETDLAELIVQLGDDLPSHVLVPAIHRNRTEIRDLFRARLSEAPTGLTDEPRELAAVARAHLRERFLSARMAVSGANFAVAETGTLCVVESEGNGRMCLTLPEVLVSVVGIEKVVPSMRALGVLLRVLAPSSTGEIMNPYTTLWSGPVPGDGPRRFDLVLLDNGRTKALADDVGREALQCIRCSACMNVCPVYSRTGGHAYGSVYPGPIGAILSPQLWGTDLHGTLPFASSLCGACADVCPVGIEIPKLLVHLRARSVDRKGDKREKAGMAAAAIALSRPRALNTAGRMARTGLRRARPIIKRMPGPPAEWARFRELPEPPKESFRGWWDRTNGGRP
jgi:L-lactate dehydrogenase complex protein LldF